MRKTQLQIVNESLLELNKMSTEELISTLAKAGLVDENDPYDNHYAFSFSSANDKAESESNLWVECVTCSHHSASFAF